MPPVPQLVRADEDAVVLIKPPRLSCRAPATSHVFLGDAGAPVHRAEEVDLAFQEADYGGVFEEPGLVFFAAGAVGGFVEVVAGGEVGFAGGGGGVAGHYAEEG